MQNIPVSTKRRGRPRKSQILPPPQIYGKHAKKAKVENDKNSNEEELYEGDT